MLEVPPWTSLLFTDTEELPLPGSQPVYNLSLERDLHFALAASASLQWLKVLSLLSLFVGDGIEQRLYHRHLLLFTVAVSAEQGPRSDFVFVKVHF